MRRREPTKALFFQALFLCLSSCFGYHSFVSPHLVILVTLAFMSSVFLPKSWRGFNLVNMKAYLFNLPRYLSCFPPRGRDVVSKDIDGIPCFTCNFLHFTHPVLDSFINELLLISVFQEALHCPQFIFQQLDLVAHSMQEDGSLKEWLNQYFPKLSNKLTPQWN
ncbi:hypothetical protein ACLOJK_008060 [Asimina triloba]